MNTNSVIKQAIPLNVSSAFYSSRFWPELTYIGDGHLWTDNRWLVMATSGVTQISADMVDDKGKLVNEAAVKV